MRSVFAALALATLVPGQPHAEPFHQRAEEGWFWYREPAPVPETSSPAPLPAPPTEEVARAPEPAPPPAPPPGPKPLSTAWFRENLDDYRDAAIDDPSPENVRAYTVLERIAGIRAAAFARAKADVTLGDPVLDVAAERPLATYGAQALDREAFEARQAIIADLARTTGFLFFFSTACPLCDAQAYVLRNLADKHGLPVLAVSLDGGPPDTDWLNGAWRPDTGQAAGLGVSEGPALFVMRPPDEIVSLGHGAMDIAMIEERLVRAARLSEWIDEAAYQSTLPVRRKTRDPGLPEIPPEVMADPGRLADYLTDLMSR